MIFLSIILLCSVLNIFAMEYVEYFDPAATTTSPHFSLSIESRDKSPTPYLSPNAYLILDDNDTREQSTTSALPNLYVPAITEKPVRKKRPYKKKKQSAPLENSKKWLCILTTTCKDKFETKKELKDHIKSNHDKVNSQCCYCQQEFKNFLFALNQHQRTCPKKTHLCSAPNCSKRYQSTNALRNHVIEKHNTEKAKKCICNKCCACDARSQQHQNNCKAFKMFVFIFSQRAMLQRFDELPD